MFGVVPFLILFGCSQTLTDAVGFASKKFYQYDQIIKEAGYPVETYDIVTDDGYILELIRIPHGKDGDSGVPRTPILLMHGLSDSAIAFLKLGPEKSLAYNLADAGLDVWLGNARGVANSRRHMSMDPDDPKETQKFFDFTWEQIALIDLPAIVDYILENTHQKRLHYVGHSQGGTVFLVMNAVRPEYNEKIISAHLLAGVGYQNNFPNRAVRKLAKSTNVIYTMSISLGVVELLGPNWGDQLENLAAYTACFNNADGICSRNNIGDIIDSIINPEELLPGASIKQYAHYGQNIRDRKFRAWNYGILNLYKYGRFTPPEYDLSKITVDMTMHYTVNDVLLDKQDVLDMVEVIPNAVARKIPRETFTHTDFVVADDAKDLIYDYIIEKIAP